jgi:hypothetical protein
MGVFGRSVPKAGTRQDSRHVKDGDPMGFMDSIKEKFGNKSKARDMARQHGDKADEGIERAGRTADEKTGGKYDDQIQKGTEKGKDAMGRHTGEDDR